MQISWFWEESELYLGIKTSKGFHKFASRLIYTYIYYLKGNKLEIRFFDGSICKIRDDIISYCKSEPSNE